jgi:outer membrane biosynthesis protein TonB
VDSRARDDASAGDANLPRSDGETDSPQIELTEAQPARDASGAPEPLSPRPDPSQLDPSQLDPSQLDTSRLDPAVPAAELSVRSLAGQDLRQLGMRNPAGNAALFGDISLSTTAWEYAPWLQAFRRAVMERWLPPAAYRMGLIDGWVQTRVEIARDGSLVGVQVLDADVGNPSLTDAVVYALTAPAPFHKLPSGFPDPTLGLTIRFVYPPVKNR